MMQSSANIVMYAVGSISICKRHWLLNIRSFTDILMYPVALIILIALFGAGCCKLALLNNL